MSQPTHLQHIGKMIKQAREMRQMSQVELAAAAMVNQSVISEIEQGKRNFEINTLVRIANALGCAIDISLTPFS